MFKMLSRLRRKKETSAIKVDEYTGEITYDGGTVKFVCGEDEGEPVYGYLNGKRYAFTHQEFVLMYVYFALMFKTMSKN